MNHRYKDDEAGRSLQTDGRTRIRNALLKCSTCTEVGRLHLRALLPPEIIDKKFKQKGWSLDPHICPDCARKVKVGKLAKAAAVLVSTEVPTIEAVEPEPEIQTTNEEQPVTMLEDSPTLRSVSANTHKAAAMMHKLLNHHFDGDVGQYESGWNDERIAQETSLSVNHVAEIRALAYGDIKEPEAVTALRGQLSKLETDITEMMAVAQREINDLKRQLSETCKKLGVRS